MERERKGIITWMLFISACLIISLVFNIKACMYHSANPPAKPTTEKVDSINTSDSIFTVKNYGDGSLK